MLDDLKGWAKAVERSTTLSDWEKRVLWKELEDDVGRKKAEQLRAVVRRQLRGECLL